MAQMSPVVKEVVAVVDHVSEKFTDVGAVQATAPRPLAATSRVQSVDRAAVLLRAVAGSGPQGVSTVDVARQCGLNRATAWRILTTLQTHTLVSSDGVGGRWHLGGAVMGLVRAAGLDAVLHDVQGVLQHVALQTGETASIAVTRDGVLTYVDEAAATVSPSGSWVGTTLSPHATSAGKVLLAWSTAAEVDSLLARSLPRYTDATVTDRGVLETQLRQVRERGYATCVGEYDDSAWGVSAPVLDPAGHLVAVLSIWGPPPRVSAARFPALADIVVEAAARIAPQAAVSR